MTEERRGEKYDGLSLVDCAKTLHDLNSQKGFLKDQMAELQKDIDVLGMSIIPDMMEEDEIDTMKITDVGRLQLRADAYCSVLAGDREAFHQWLRDNNQEPLIKETVHPGTLKAWVKGQIKAGAEYPQEFVKYEAYSKAVIVSA